MLSPVNNKRPIDEVEAPAQAFEEPEAMLIIRHCMVLTSSRQYMNDVFRGLNSKLSELDDDVVEDQEYLQKKHVAFATFAIGNCETVIVFDTLNDMDFFCKKLRVCNTLCSIKEIDVSSTARVMKNYTPKLIQQYEKEITAAANQVTLAERLVFF